MEYYGSYKIVAPTRSRTTGKLKWCAFMLLAGISLATLCINSYVLVQTHKDMEFIIKEFEETIIVMRSVYEFVAKDIKPKIDLINSVLSYQLPQAVLNAFKRSNHELSESLSDITINLAQLLELYKSILGFDDDWMLTPESQQLTCALTSYDNSSYVFERFEKKRMTSDYWAPKNMEKFEAELRDTIGNIFNDTSPTMKPGSKAKLNNILGYIQDYMGWNKPNNKYGTQLTPKPWTEDQNYNGPTPKPARSEKRAKRSLSDSDFETDKITYTNQSITDDHTKFRYVVKTFGELRHDRAKRSSTKNDKFEVHTITDTPDDICRFSKNLLKLPKNICMSNSRMMEFLKCFLT